MSKYISAFRRGDTKQITVSRSGKDSSGSHVPVPFLSGSTLTLSLKSDLDQPVPIRLAPARSMTWTPASASFHCLQPKPLPWSPANTTGTSNSSRTRLLGWQQRLWPHRQATGRTGSRLWRT